MLFTSEVRRWHSRGGPELSQQEISRNFLDAWGLDNHNE